MYIEDLVNTSSSQSLRRSIRTSLTTLFAMVAVVVVSAIMGLDSIQHFAIPMAVGILVGTYHSICFVPSLWVWWQKRRGVETLKVIPKKRRRQPNKPIFEQKEAGRICEAAYPPAFCFGGEIRAAGS